MGIPNSFAKRCSSIFHNRRRLPLRPPPSAVIINLSAFGYFSLHIAFHHRRIVSTGISRRAIHAGLDELESRESGAETEIKKGKIRKSGGGRKKVTEKDPKLKADLERLVEATTRGDPESPLRWTCKSLRIDRKSVV